jgi:hypothetical protein
MRHHFQGVILLIVMLLVLWATLETAGPVVSDALTGDERALVAESSDDTAEDLPEDAPPPLTEEEVLELQAALTEVGYSPGTIDGALGPATQEAVDLAIADRNLPETITYRSLTSRLQAEIAGLDPEGVLPELDWDAIGDLVEAEARAEANQPG